MAKANNADTFIGGTYGGVPGEFTPANLAALQKFFAQIPRGTIGPGDSAPDYEKLADARQYCAEAVFKHMAGQPNEALYQLICAVDHLIAAWQQ